MMEDRSYRHLMDEILTAAKEVHSILGDGFLEQVYEEALYHELALRGIPSERQFNLDVIYKEIVLDKKYTPDLIVDNRIIVEIKTIKDLTTIEETQLTNYLQIANMQGGILLNFGKKLEAKKRVLISPVIGEPTTGTPTDPEELKRGNNPEPL